VVRLIAAVGITHFSGYLFGDESEYVILGRLAAAGHLTPAFWSGYGETLFHTAGSFMWPIVLLFKLFGANRLVAALWAGLFGAVTAALTALIVDRALGRRWSALAGLTVALFPSQVLWSSVVLRESMVWAGLCGAAVGILIFSQAKHWQSLAGATLIVGVALLSLAFLRSWALLPAAWAAALAVWLFRPARPMPTRALCALLCLLVPLASGLGLAGNSYVRHHGQKLGYERSVLAENAKSAFVPDVQPTNVPGAQPAADALVVPNGLSNDLRALPRGFVAFTLRPFPWQHGEGLSYDFAAVEELLYYPLYLLALIGVVAYRRRRDLIAFPLLVTVLLTGIASDAEGNLGSAFRHRDQLFWAVTFFAALGANYLWTRWRHHKDGEEQLAPAGGDERPLTVQASR